MKNMLLSAVAIATTAVCKENVAKSVTRLLQAPSKTDANADFSAQPKKAAELAANEADVSGGKDDEAPDTGSGIDFTAKRVFFSSSPGQLRRGKYPD